VNSVKLSTTRGGNKSAIRHTYVEQTESTRERQIDVNSLLPGGFASRRWIILLTKYAVRITPRCSCEYPKFCGMSWGRSIRQILAGFATPKLRSTSKLAHHDSLPRKQFKYHAVYVVREHTVSIDLIVTSEIGNRCRERNVAILTLRPAFSAFSAPASPLP
jgi:hypothetical protein